MLTKSPNKSIILPYVSEYATHFYFNITKKSQYTLTLHYGVDGSRTRVQKPIHCPSTIIVNYLTFPLSNLN